MSDPLAEHLTADPAKPARVFALDALRGLAILGMVLSGTVPERVLPAWMYHAQERPPLHDFTPGLPGLTWVDLVFPFFLFAMGAAIPLALTRRLERGLPQWRVVLHILSRGVLLGGFALYVQHIRPWGLGPYSDTARWLLALLAFALLFPILARLPARWPLSWRVAVRLLGWAGAVLLMASLHHQAHRHHGGGATGFSVERSDIIIVLLANAAVFGSLVWLATRNNLLLRLASMGFLVGLRLSATAPGWVEWLAGHSPLPWMVQLEYLQWLFLTIPGTIVGDMLVRWGRERGGDTAARAWSGPRLAGFALLLSVTIVAMLAGLQSRWVWQTTVLAVVLCALGRWAVSGPGTKTERLVKDVFGWGAFCLLVGLVCEPFEGGISKVPDKLSYFFVSGGLAMFALLLFTLLIEMWGQRRRLQLLIENGENPMIAYVGGGNFVIPILALTHLRGLLETEGRGPWLGMLMAIITTLVVAYTVRLFTRLRIYWRT